MKEGGTTLEKGSLEVPHVNSTVLLLLLLLLQYVMQKQGLNAGKRLGNGFHFQPTFWPLRPFSALSDLETDFPRSNVHFSKRTLKTFSASSSGGGEMWWQAASKRKRTAKEV